MLAVFHLMPPPFPFTLFVLVAGAFKIRLRLFFGSLIVCRLMRFGIATIFAARYGNQIAEWITSDVVAKTMLWVIATCIIGTLLTLARLVRAATPQRSTAS